MCSCTAKKIAKGSSLFWQLLYSLLPSDKVITCRRQHLIITLHATFGGVIACHHQHHFDIFCCFTPPLSKLLITSALSLLITPTTHTTTQLIAMYWPLFALFTCFFVDKMTKISVNVGLGKILINTLSTCRVPKLAMSVSNNAWYDNWRRHFLFSGAFVKKTIKFCLL